MHSSVVLKVNTGPNVAAPGIASKLLAAADEGLRQPLRLTALHVWGTAGARRASGLKGWANTNGAVGNGLEGYPLACSGTMSRCHKAVISMLAGFHEEWNSGPNFSTVPMIAQHISKTPVSRRPVDISFKQ